MYLQSQHPFLGPGGIYSMSLPPICWCLLPILGIPRLVAISIQSPFVFTLLSPYLSSRLHTFVRRTPLLPLYYVALE